MLSFLYDLDPRFGKNWGIGVLFDAVIDESLFNEP